METNPARDRRLAWLIALIFFIALAPTLPWQEFSSSPENLVLATSMEMRRGGPWLVPNLQGEPRLAKPPLAAWITAFSIQPQTVRQLDQLDHDQRERGFLLLAIEARWPALLSACLLLLGVFELGKAIGDSSLGLTATAICASSYFLLRFARYSTTDIQLALWVTWANVFLAWWIVRGRSWTGCIGAGITLGLAMMSKGPVGLLQSVVPFAVFEILRKSQAHNHGEPASAGGALPMSPPHKSDASGTKVPPPERTGGAVALGVILFLITGFWWYALVLLRHRNVLATWFSEVTRIGATGTAPSPVFTYAAIVGYVAPWTVFFLVGIVVILRRIIHRRKIDGDFLALLLLIVPLLLMSFAKDRQDRYALPMIPAAALVAAIGVREHLKSWLAPSGLDLLLRALHWLTLAAMAVAFPLVATTSLLKQTDGQPWFTVRFTITESLLGAILVVSGILMHRNRRGALVMSTLLIMLVVQGVAFRGYCSSPAGRSDFKLFADLLWGRYPDALFYNAHPTGKRPPTDLAVYLNRTIRWTNDPSVLRVDTHPLVLLMLQNKGEREPAPPPDWNYVDKIRRDKDWWWAFVLPPQ